MDQTQLVPFFRLPVYHSGQFFSNSTAAGMFVCGFCYTELVTCSSISGRGCWKVRFTRSLEILWKSLFLEQVPNVIIAPCVGLSWAIFTNLLETVVSFVVDHNVCGHTSAPMFSSSIEFKMKSNFFLKISIWNSFSYANGIGRWLLSPISACQ